MNSLVRVFSNFKEFYNEINGATLTGAIDVIVVEQPNGEFICSPFHVRFGKLGVLRSREKVVDIEINGEPVDIHMKLGESGEAFFVEECSENDDLPADLATSPIPTNTFDKFEAERKLSIVDDDSLPPLPIPRRNSIDLSKECNEESNKKFENQISDYTKRRHTDNTMERRILTAAKLEYTTQKIREEWAVHEEQLFPFDALDDMQDNKLNKKLQEDISDLATKEENRIDSKNNIIQATQVVDSKNEIDNTIVEVETKTEIKEESKSKKKRRKKSQMKKKNSLRKSSSDLDSISISNNTGSSNDDSIKTDDPPKTQEVVIEEKRTNNELNSPQNRIRDIDMHFFSDTELASGSGPRDLRPSTPIQSDSELEISQREKETDTQIMTSSASWKWGELPTKQNSIQKDAPEAQRSMLSSMFSFMRKNNKLRKNANEGIYLSDLETDMDPEMAALYFPNITNTTKLNINEEDRESGNGTSLPHSPNSMEGQKSIDSDYDDGKQPEKYLDFVAMSLCGGLDGSKEPTLEEFEKHSLKYSDVCRNPDIFSSPNLIVRLNGKYYTWKAACPIVMTIITFQKPLSDEVIEKLMQTNINEKTSPNKTDTIPIDVPQQNEEAKRGYSWWTWRRSGGGEEKSDLRNKDIDNKNDPVHSAVGTQTSRSHSPDNISNTHDFTNEDKNESFETNGNDSLKLNDTSTSSTDEKVEKYKKSLRLSSEQIKSLNLKPGMNEIEFSVTTAYQGTSRCKCYLFRWKHCDKVVISDIDGTITKSDVLGHILPMVGKDWAQIGVAQLFSKIAENGYKLLYLSARAIGQSRVTREYLRSIRQGNVKLPNGPLLLNPTSLISAFHREVIERKPEHFKIACLSDINTLFPNKNPFYAGYGNRINDVWAYRAVGIPIMRIFTINTKGELKHELTQTFQSSYCSMTYIVDQLFPPIKDDECCIEFSNFNYWRDPILDFDINTTILSHSKSLTTIAE